MRVLVTGGAGYIGTCTIEELLAHGHDVRVLEAFFWGRTSLDHLEHAIEMVEGDIRSSKDVCYALQGVDAVVHLAGIVGEPACKVNPIAHFTTNVECVSTLVDCMTDPELGLVRDLIFASSCSIYGNVAGLYDEVTEDTPPAPLSAYAHAKLRAEQIVRDKAALTPHFHPTVLRLTTLFGWSPRPRLDLVTNKFSHDAVRNRAIYINGDGQQYRSLVHVRDVARAIVAVLEAPRFMRDRRVFHVGDERNNRTVKQIAELVKSNLPRTEIVMRPSAPTDRRDYRINCQLIRNLINWRSTVSVEAGIAEMIEHFSKSNIDLDRIEHGNAQFQYA
jgi:nucleoside-diphosphate-sugar epimerase